MSRGREGESLFTVYNVLAAQYRARVDSVFYSYSLYENRYLRKNDAIVCRNRGDKDGKIMEIVLEYFVATIREFFSFLNRLS